MARLAVFVGPRPPGARSGGTAALRRRLARPAGELEYEFHTSPAARGGHPLDPALFAGALLPVSATTPAAAVRAARRGLPGRPIGGIAVAPDSAALRKIDRLGLDFLVEAWGERDPLPRAVLAHLQGARRPAARRHEKGSPPQTTRASARHPHRRGEDRQLDPGAP